MCFALGAQDDLVDASGTIVLLPTGEVDWHPVGVFVEDNVMVKDITVFLSGSLLASTDPDCLDGVGIAHQPTSFVEAVYHLLGNVIPRQPGAA